MGIDYIKIGEKLKDYRVKNKLTQTDVAEVLGISTAFLSRIERGLTTVSLNRLLELTKIYKINIQDVLGEENQFYQEKDLDKKIKELLNDCTDEQKELLYRIIKSLAQVDLD